MKSLNEYCLERGDELLLRQWHPMNNGDLRPETAAANSHKKVWWRCERGHEWQARISSRTVDGTGCPVCTNRRVASGENDLATLWPSLAGEWHPKRNGTLTPDQVSPGTRRKVWWRCAQGHEWQSSVMARTSNGTGCPFCAGKAVIPGVNDLGSLFPALAAQWDTQHNGSLLPEKISAYSSRRVWWLCEKGHAWQAAVSVRTVQNSGCPYCAGRKVMPGFNDLATTAPEIAEQWAAELNGVLTPRQVTASSHRRVWWQCPAGHTWKAVVYARAGSARRSGCPVCAGRVREDRAERYAMAMAQDMFKSGGSRI